MANEERSQQFLNNDAIGDDADDTEQDIINDLRIAAEQLGIPDDLVDAALAEAQADGAKPEVQAEFEEIKQEALENLQNADASLQELIQNQSDEKAQLQADTARVDSLVNQIKERIGPVSVASKADIDDQTRAQAEEILAIHDKYPSEGQDSIKPDRLEQLRRELNSDNTSNESLAVDIFSIDLDQGQALSEAHDQQFKAAQEVLKEARETNLRVRFESPAIALFKKNLIDKLDEIPSRVEALKKLEELQERERALSNEISTKRKRCETLCKSAGQTLSHFIPQDSGQTGSLLASAPQQTKAIIAQKTLTKHQTPFNKRFNSRNLPAQSTRALAYSPRKVTGNNGITAISQHAFNARFDLREWRQTQKRKYGQTVRIDADGNPVVDNSTPLINLPGFLGDNRFNLFGSSSVTIGNNDAGGIGQDSLSYSVSGGVSWLVQPKLNIGLAARYSDGDVDSATSTIDTSTWGIAAFAQTQIDAPFGKVNLEGVAAYSRSDIDALFNNIGVITTTDQNTTAFSSQLKASTSFKLDEFSISPFASLSYIETDRDAFTLSDGQFQNGSVTDQVIFSAGSSLSTSYIIPDTEITLSPSLGFGVFSAVADDSNVGLGVNGGLGIKTKRGISGSLGVGFSGLTGDTSNLSFSGSLSIPLN